MYNIYAPNPDVGFIYYLSVFIVVMSVFAFMVGVGLAIRNTVILRFYGFMYRKFSLRKMSTSLFEPHFIEPALNKHLKMLGIAIILGASASIFVLLGIDAEVFQPVFVDVFVKETSGILAGYTKSFLFVGNVICVGIGLLALFSPRMLTKIEAYTDKWYTLGIQTRVMSELPQAADNWIIAHPTISGLTLSILSLLVGVSIYVQI